MKSQPMILDLCHDGAHSPRRPTLVTPNGGRRTVCRACGCTLMQTGTTRKWILSGCLA